MKAPRPTIFVCILIFIIACTQTPRISPGVKTRMMFRTIIGLVPIVPQEPPQNAPIKYGDKGRLYVADHSVALYDGFVQRICDREDSACYDYTDGLERIADHNTQGFGAIKTVNIGDCCFIRTSDGKERKYVCERIEPEGRNDLTDLYDRDGRSVYDSGYDMIMYTCNTDWRHITIVFWNRI